LDIPIDARMESKNSQICTYFNKIIGSCAVVQNSSRQEMH
jgi:hypothetical protein